jgi:transcriptional regulator with PAS, ATPase and Fis domain
MEQITWDSRDPYRIVGVSKAAERLRGNILKYSTGSASVLITGETGTGKELVARNLHWWSDRRTMPFIVVNSGSLEESMLVAELFGHIGHSFTGAANQGRKGAIEEAEGGILFLDEIGNLVDHGQNALLRALEKKVKRVGSAHEKKVQYRLISATNTDVDKAVAEGRIHKDFFYRIKGIAIHVAPLRERKEDIPVLVPYIISKYVQEAGMKTKDIDPAAMHLLVDYDWPGNIRQLENVIEVAMYNADDTISPDNVEETLLGPSHQDAKKAEHKTLIERCFEVGVTVKSFERELTSIALARTGGNRKKASALLGISYRTFLNHQMRYGNDGNGGHIPDNGNGNTYAQESVQPVVQPAVEPSK